jgi:hypothetical protein
LLTCCNLGLLNNEKEKKKTEHIREGGRGKKNGEEKDQDNGSQILAAGRFTPAYE